MDYRDIILESLHILKKKESLSKEPTAKFKVAAYEKVIKQIDEISEPIYSRDDLSHVTGIGKKIEEKLREIFETGKLSAAKRAKDVLKDTEEIYDALLGIHGIGPSKAKELIEDYNVKNIQDVKKLIELYPDILTRASKIGIKHYDDFLLRIPRSEMEIHNEVIQEEKTFKFMKAVMVGSYRRKLPNSGDIDILIKIDKDEKKASEIFHLYIENLIDVGYLTDILSLGKNKCLAVCKVDTHYRRIDFLLTSKEEFPFAELYFTGSKHFNMEMRKHALKLGWSLSEHGLERINAIGPGPKVSIRIEKDIFTFLSLKYVKPENRI